MILSDYSDADGITKSTIDTMNIVSYGGGVDSTAMLIGMYQRNIRVDLILFADTGGEKPETYEYIEIMNEWLRQHGMPPIQVVKYTDRNGARLTLEEECLRCETLPSLAYGFKRCSLKHKISVQDKIINNHPMSRPLWDSGLKINKFIGFDAGEMQRMDKIRERDLRDKKYQKQYPLIQWGWNRNACIEKIAAEGLPVPLKSACFFALPHGNMKLGICANAITICTKGQLRSKN